MSKKQQLAELETKEMYIGKILRIISIAMDDDRDLDWIFEDVERIIETYRMINQ